MNYQWGGGGDIDVDLLGGEPLLNPHINRIMSITRSYFKRGIINLVTNGLLLATQTDEFWNCCRENDITIIISIYLTGLDCVSIMNKSKEFNVKLLFRGDTRTISQFSHKCENMPIEYESNEYWRKMPIDLSGRQNPAISNTLCSASNFCFQLVEGKLYKCWRIAYIKYFNNYFDRRLEVTNDDYISIEKVSSMDEILDKLRRPVPFCRYCKMSGGSAVSWENSKKAIEEWI